MRRSLSLAPMLALAAAVLLAADASPEMRAEEAIDKARAKRNRKAARRLAARDSGKPKVAP